MANQAISRDESPRDDHTLAGGSHAPTSQRAKMSRKRDELQEKADQILTQEKQIPSDGSGHHQHSLQDRLFATVISQVVSRQHAGPPPSSTSPSNHHVIPPVTLGKKSKPDFSARLMAHNFRRFNARIGFFVPLQRNLLSLFSWSRPTATLSFLAVHTLVCLEPRLLPSLPFAAIIFGITLPSFLALHPSPSDDPEVVVGAPKLPDPPADLEPATEFSAEFWRNLAVLQNGMGEFAELYDTVHDDLLACVTFRGEGEEGMASALFPVLLVAAFVATFGTSLLSWQISALVGGWALTIGAHPAVQGLLASLSDLPRLRRQLQGVQAALRQWSRAEVVVRAPRLECRRVEIFELQRHHAYSDTWEPWLFAPSPWEPLSAARVAGARAKGTQFFEDVRAPVGWAWKDPKWHLDLFSREWVEQRMITGVEIETEGERWVYDFPPEDDEGGAQGHRNDDRLLAPAKEMRRRTSSVARSGWQEMPTLQKRGEWRRRRWTRLVERTPTVKRNAEPPVE